MDNIKWLPLIVATVLTAALWLAVVWARSIAKPGQKEFNPLVLTQGPFGRASLANLQLLFFLVIVIWIDLPSCILGNRRCSRCLKTVSRANASTRWRNMPGI